MIAWLLARFFCWRRGHNWRLLTADLRYSGCHDCGAQKTNDVDELADHGEEALLP